MSGLMQWLSDFLLWVPRFLFASMLDGLNLLFESLPVPGFIGSIAGLWSAIAPGVWWFLSAFLVPEGIALLLAAGALRFTLRRIPFIG